jgi:hypothetical protein
MMAAVPATGCALPQAPHSRTGARAAVQRSSAAFSSRFQSSRPAAS